jgi:hypothetical protein
MKPFRWLAAGLLWILAGVVGLLGAVLSITVILLPLGIPLLLLARKLGGWAGTLLVPKAVRHPVQEAASVSSDTASSAGKGAGKLLGRGRKAVAEVVPTRRKRGLARLKWWG